MIKLRRMRWAGHIAHIGESSEVYGVVVEKSEGKETIWKTNVLFYLKLTYHIYNFYTFPI